MRKQKKNVFRIILLTAVLLITFISTICFVVANPRNIRAFFILALPPFIRTSPFFIVTFFLIWKIQIHLTHFVNYSLNLLFTNDNNENYGTYCNLFHPCYHHIHGFHLHLIPLLSPHNNLIDHRTSSRCQYIFLFSRIWFRYLKHIDNLEKNWINMTID